MRGKGQVVLNARERLALGQGTRCTQVDEQLEVGDAVSLK
jgi:hypothetical protein